MPLSRWNKLLNTVQIRKNYAERPAGLRWRSNTFFVLATIGMGLFTDLFLYGLIIPDIPFLLEDRVGLPQSQIQSYTSALLAVYAGTCVVLSPFLGYFADKVTTRQAPFLIGLSTLIASTVVLFLSRTIALIVTARILQGASSAVVWTIGLAMCVETVGPKNLGKAIGTIFSVIALGAAWAPAAGGILYEKTGIEGVMAISLIVLAIDFIMRVLVIEKKIALKYPEDENDTSTTSEAEAEGERQPLLDHSEAEEDLTDYILTSDQTKSKLNQSVKILPCLRNASLLTSFLLSFVQALMFGSIDSTVAIVCHELFGFNSLQAGVMFLPLAVMDLITGPIAGWAIDRYGTKPVATLGFGWLIPVHVLLRLPHAGGWDQIVIYGFLMAGLGIGCAMTGSPSIVEGGTVVERYYKANPEFFGESAPYAQLYGMNSALFNLGLTVGPELAGELKEAIGYGNMNIVFAVIVGITAVLSYLYVGGRPTLINKDENGDDDDDDDDENLS